MPRDGTLLEAAVPPGQGMPRCAERAIVMRELLTRKSS